jgi:hypothetical protein
MQSPLSCHARRLFAHLPGEVVDGLCNPQSPPTYDEMSGHVTLLADAACYVLTEDGVLGVRGLEDGSNEIVTYRDGEVLSRTIMPAEAAR